jgi:hypothetical protein
MEAASSSESSIAFYKTLRLHIPENGNIKRIAVESKPYYRPENHDTTRRMFTAKHRPLREAQYVTPCVANLTEEKSRVSMSQAPTGIMNTGGM